MLISVAGLRIAVLLCALPALAATTREVLWQNPGRIEALDLYYGPGGGSGAPRPPFRYLGKDAGGSTEKLIVRDARSRIWDVKLGEEARPEVFATRLVWALGYYADPSYLVPRARIKGQTYRNARFELRNPRLTFRSDMEWTWKENPFAGTRELNGLRIVVMLLSDWDNKDARDWSSNTGVIESRRAGRRTFTYFVTDWGASMGKWGGFFTREKWDCEDYTEQSASFVKAVDEGEIRWGFKGQHSGAFKDDITVADVRWLIRYLGRVRDAQLRAALRASGANPHETRCFTRALRSRIGQLQRLARLTPASSVRLAAR
jgi:hypothetical protein